jgi:hypothetical protein
MEHDFQEIVKQSWQRSSAHVFLQKTKFLAADLRKWRRKKPKNPELLAQIENKILQEQNLHPTLENHTLQEHLHDKHQSLLAKEETYHIQRLKKTWAVKGDRNTEFFCKAIVKRHRKNKISSLQNPDGSFSTTPAQLADTLTGYFTPIFTSNNPTTSDSPNHSLDSISQVQTPTTSVTDHFPGSQQHQSQSPTQSPRFNFTNSIPTITEVHQIVKSMRSNATPGPDGLNVAFYKSSWTLVKHDVYKVVTDFYTHATISPDINKTFISLIPKKIQPLVPHDYRSIGICKAIYKIISKSTDNRVKDHLPDYIHQAQTAFIANKHISSNVIITQEIIHSFNLKSWQDQAFLLKLNLAKAFDRIEWSFIVTALHRIGFNNHFINLIHACISTSYLSILVNDEPTNYFYPQRGLRQGCPL